MLYTETMKLFSVNNGPSHSSRRQIPFWASKISVSFHGPYEHSAADLVLFRVSPRSDLGRGEYFVYKAASGGGNKRPSLRLLGDAQRYLQYQYRTALLARRDVGDGDDDGHYYVATLNYNLERPATFNLVIYNSADEKWRVTRPVSLRTENSHFTSKVIALGDRGVLGFADPWRGILVCDVFGRRPDHFLPLPQHLVTFDKPGSDPNLFRDVAVVDGRLTVVELHRAVDPDTGNKLNSWDLSTWSISSPWDGQDQDGWRMEYAVRSRDVVVDDDNAALIARVPEDDGGMSRRTLGRLQLAHPILSLSDRRVVYLMAKVSIRERKRPLMLSVDMENRRLRRAAVFDAERMFGIAFGYTLMQSPISRYFDMASGQFKMLYPRKLQAGVNVEDDTNMAID
ncbi:hypothetical protein EJB05_39648, partial [Eragrostis curvula]